MSSILAEGATKNAESLYLMGTEKASLLKSEAFSAPLIYKDVGVSCFIRIFVVKSVQFKFCFRIETSTFRKSVKNLLM